MTKRSDSRAKALAGSMVLLALLGVLWVMYPKAVDTEAMTPEEDRKAQAQARALTKLITRVTLRVLGDLKEFARDVAVLVCAGTALRGFWGGKVPRGWLVGSVSAFLLLSITQHAYGGYRSYTMQVRHLALKAALLKDGNSQ